VRKAYRRIAMPNAYISYSLGWTRERQGQLVRKPTTTTSDLGSLSRIARGAAMAGSSESSARTEPSEWEARCCTIARQRADHAVRSVRIVRSFTTLNNPVSYNFSDSPRFNGGLPQFPAPPTGGFPYTPPNVNAISGEFQGIASNLHSALFDPVERFF